MAVPRGLELLTFGFRKPLLYPAELRDRFESRGRQETQFLSGFFVSGELIGAGW